MFAVASLYPELILSAAILILRAGGRSREIVGALTLECIECVISSVVMTKLGSMAQIHGSLSPSLTRAVVPTGIQASQFQVSIRSFLASIFVGLLCSTVGHVLHVAISEHSVHGNSLFYVFFGQPHPAKLLS